MNQCRATILRAYEKQSSYSYNNERTYDGSTWYSRPRRMVTIYATFKTKNASALKQDQTYSVGIDSWAAPKNWTELEPDPSGRPDNPMAIGHIPHVIYPWDSKLRTRRRRREQTSRDPLQQLRPDTVPIPLPRPHKPLITSTDGSRVNNHR
jgi:hypothetical protein